MASKMERLRTHDGQVQGWGHICPRDGLWHEANPWVNENLCPSCAQAADYQAENPVGRAYVIHREIWAHRCKGGTRRLPTGVPCGICAGHYTLVSSVWEHDCTAVVTRRRLLAMDSCPSCGLDAQGEGNLDRVWEDDAKTMEVLRAQRSAERAANGVPPLPAASDTKRTQMERYGHAMMAAVTFANIKMMKPGTIVNKNEGEAMVNKNEDTSRVGEALSAAAKVLRQDGIDAALRTAGNQFVKGTKEPLVALLQRHLAPGDESMRARIASFLDTELGGAIVASLLSLGLSAMPQDLFGGAPVIMARELRVRAMAGVGDVVADALIGPLRETASLYLKGVPDPTVSPMLAESDRTSGVRVSFAADPVPLVRPGFGETESLAADLKAAESRSRGAGGRR